MQLGFEHGSLIYQSEPLSTVPSMNGSFMIIVTFTIRPLRLVLFFCLQRAFKYSLFSSFLQNLPFSFIRPGRSSINRFLRLSPALRFNAIANVLFQPSLTDVILMLIGDYSNGNVLSPDCLHG